MSLEIKCRFFVKISKQNRRKTPHGHVAKTKHR